MQQPSSSEQKDKDGYKQTEMNMKRIIVILVAVAAALQSYAQVSDFSRRYDALVSRNGLAGVGVETLLDRWKAADSTDVKMLTGRFNYYFFKAQSTEVVAKDQKKYLGMEPVLTLADSTGKNVHYYQISVFDDELYVKAMEEVDKAVRIYPDMLDFRFFKANAYVAYEKESPDMTLSYLLGLVSEFASHSGEWTYDGEKADAKFFQEAMQEYCVTFYTIGSPVSLDAFLSLAKRMNQLYPDNPAFLTDIGSYYMQAKGDCKTALKYYAKALKKDGSDYTAIKNAAIAARKLKKTSQEKKYLKMLIEKGPEHEKPAAQARLNALQK